jgi:hypothetical protein
MHAATIRRDRAKFIQFFVNLAALYLVARVQGYETPKAHSKKPFWVE